MNNLHVMQRKWSIRVKRSNNIFEHDKYIITSPIVGKPSIIVLTTTDMVVAEYIVGLHHTRLAALGNHIGERMSATIDELKKIK